MLIFHPLPKALTKSFRIWAAPTVRKQGLDLFPNLIGTPHGLIS